MSKLQGKVHDVFKSKAGYNYKYADLSSILDISRPLCAEFELAVSQLCGNNGFDSTPNNDGAVIQTVSLETILMHSSGEWISSELEMLVQPMKGMTAAQSAGTVITYARRYALAALLGIAQTDNDAADVNVESAQLKSNVAKTSNVQHDHKELFQLIEELKVPETEINNWLARVNCSALTQLTLDQAKKLVTLLKKRKAAVPPANEGV